MPGLRAMSCDEAFDATRCRQVLGVQRHRYEWPSLSENPGPSHARELTSSLGQLLRDERLQIGQSPPNLTLFLGIVLLQLPSE